MAYKYANFVKAPLVQSLTAVATTLYVDSAIAAATFPTLGVSDKFRAVLWDNIQAPEIVDITAYTGGTCTIERGKEGTAAAAWGQGTMLSLAPTAELLQQSLAAVSVSKYDGSATGTNDLTLDVGTGNAIPILSDQEEVSFILPNTNTGPLTLMVTNGEDDTTVEDLVDFDGEDFLSGQAVAGMLMIARYDGSLSKWRSISQVSYRAKLNVVNQGPVWAYNLHKNNGFRQKTNGDSVSLVTSNTETLDEWWAIWDGTIGTAAVTQEDFADGYTAIPNFPEHYLQWNQSVAGSGSSFRGLYYNPPGRLARYSGKPVTVGYWMWADSNRNVTLELSAKYGSGGSPSADVTESLVCALTTTPQFFTVTLDVPLNSTKTLGTNDDDRLEVFFSFPVNTTMAIRIAEPQEVIGPLPHVVPYTPFPLGMEYGGTGVIALSGAALLAEWGGLSESSLLTAILNVDGSGSGIDADTLDTFHASSFGRKDQSQTWGGTQTFTNAPVFGDPAATRTALNLGTIATQNANNVTISGGAITGTSFASGSVNASSFLRLGGKAALVHAGSYTSGNVTQSASGPSGGSDGDIWLET